MTVLAHRLHLPAQRFLTISPPPGSVRGIAISVSVRLCVARLSVRPHISKSTRQSFTKYSVDVTRIAVTQSSSVGNAKRCRSGFVDDVILKTVLWTYPKLACVVGPTT